MTFQKTSPKHFKNTKPSSFDMMPYKSWSFIITLSSARVYKQLCLGIKKENVQGPEEFFKTQRTTKTHQNHIWIRRTRKISCAGPIPREVFTPWSNPYLPSAPLTFSSVPLPDVWHSGPGILPLLNDDFYFATLGSNRRSWHGLWFWWQRPNNISIYFLQGNKTSL